MTTFTKWFLINAVVLTAIFFAEQKQIISNIITNDQSYLSIVIMSLYVIMSGYVGRLCFLSNKMNQRKKKEATDHLKRKSEIGWFAADHFFSLGLLGTIIGLTISTHGSMDSSMTTSQIVAGLKAGLNTAFYTTLCGIIFSLPLQVQLMVLKHGLDE